MRTLWSYMYINTCVFVFYIFLQAIMLKPTNFLSLLIIFKAIAASHLKFGILKLLITKVHLRQIPSSIGILLEFVVKTA